MFFWGEMVEMQRHPLGKNTLTGCWLIPMKIIPLEPEPQSPQSFVRNPYD